MKYLQISTYVKNFYISLDVMTKNWLIVLFDSKFTSFYKDKIAYQKLVIMAVNQFGTNSFEYKRQAFMV